MAEFKVPDIHGFIVMTKAAYEDYQASLAARRSLGRYTLEEAAMAIEAATGERADAMLKKLMAAAESRDLLVYGPRENARYLHGPGHATCVREFYEEAYWDDLNEWLDNHERRISWRFPDPSANASTDASSSKQTGVPSADIIEKFRLGNEWHERLKHRQRYKYLKPPVLAQPGGRGNGKGKNLWNPARFAKMLMDVHGKNLKAMHTIMTNTKNNFDGWLDEWHEISGWNDK